MRLSESIERVMELQTQYSNEMTQPMKERLKLVHDAIPSAFRESTSDFAAVLKVEQTGLLIEGRANLGQNSEIPWVRIAEKMRSPSATKDWYVVVLFAADGGSCWIQIGRGSTTWDGRSFRNVALGDLKSDCALLVQQLGDAVPDGWNTRVELHATRTKLGVAYEAACALGVVYERGRVPDDSTIIADTQKLVSLLASVYALRPANVPAVTVEQEVAIAVQLADAAASPKRAGGQGFGLTAAERKAVEQRAVDVATEHLRTIGWEQITDVGATQSYDLDCSRGEQKLYVEVKGSTSAGGSVILTKNEVEFHRKNYPNNALAVVSGISLDKELVLATGGELHWVAPWSLAPEDLQPLSYVYTTGL